MCIKYSNPILPKNTKIIIGIGTLSPKKPSNNKYSLIISGKYTKSTELLFLKNRNTPNNRCNYFNIKSRLSLRIWEENDWLYGEDNRGWFQWYCRYYCGRRNSDVDEKQINRWRSFKRHYGAVKKNCNGDLSCRPKQRQALLQWSYNCFI